MTEKEKRIIQADELKTGIYAGRYYLTITTFDGRKISRKEYKTKEELNRAAALEKINYKHYATVTKTIEFYID